MLVGELLERVRAGESIRAIATELGVDPSTTLQRRLKKIGYAYTDNQWTWGGEGDEPLTEDILAAFTSRPRKTSTTTKKEVNVDKPATPKQRITDGLTAKEVDTLRAMIRAFNEGNRSTTGGGESLHDRLKQLPRNEEKARLNVFLSQSIAAALEGFCERERLGKSEALEIAVQDLIARFSGE